MCFPDWHGPILTHVNTYQRHTDKNTVFLPLERGMWIKGKRKWEKGYRRSGMRKRRRAEAVYWSHEVLLSADEEQRASRETTVNTTAESKLTASTLNLTTITITSADLNSPIVLRNWSTTWPTSDYVWFSRKYTKKQVKLRQNQISWRFDIL